jgi:hypothetical protein
MNAYTPRRASKTRWLQNAPDHVLDCFKNKSGTYDVLYCGVLLSPLENRTFANCRVSGREMDADPSHPQGIGVSFELSAWDAARYRARNAHRRVKWADLPAKVKTCVASEVPQA